MKKKEEEFYYKNLCSAMEYAYQAAQFLTETLKHFDKETIQEKLDAMHELEQKGDVKKHKMMKALSQAFITPIEGKISSHSAAISMILRTRWRKCCFRFI